MKTCGTVGCIREATYNIVNSTHNYNIDQCELCTITMVVKAIDKHENVNLVVLTTGESISCWP